MNGIGLALLCTAVKYTETKVLNKTLQNLIKTSNELFPFLFTGTDLPAIGLENIARTELTDLCGKYCKIG